MRKGELLYCWVSRGFNVLVPKLRNAVADAVQCDVFGLDGALEFVCSGAVYFGGDARRGEFASKVVPLLERHYGIAAREIDSAEFWRLNPSPGE
jgi:hypothetical protein